MVVERKILSENLKRLMVTEYMRREVERAGFGGVEIQRTPLGYRITLKIERPGLVIGKGGARINTLTEKVKEDFGFENPQIEVEEVKEAYLNPLVMARKLSSALERGWHFRRTGHSTVRRIMEAGAKGCQVIISGKLTGQRHRTAKFTAGHIKYCGEPAELYMQDGQAEALTKTGVLGVKVKIMRGDVKLPDEVEIVEEIDTVKVKKSKEVTGNKDEDEAD